MRKDTKKIRIPNPHGNKDISVGLLKEILRQAEINDTDWGNAQQHPVIPAKAISGDFDTIKQVMEGVNWVFHAAVVASAQKSIEDPIGTQKTNYQERSMCWNLPDSVEQNV